MARFSFGKGKRKTHWDVEQLGRTLRTQDIDPVSPRLPGFRTFPNEAAARAEMRRLVAEYIAKEFVPADDDARSIAPAADTPKSDTAPVTLPIRRDVNVYNEATGMMVTSMDMAGVTLDEGSKKWNKAVADGKMIPMMLIQDDPFNVRVVAGEPITAQEAEEWVARVEWPLDIPGGKLAITGGAVLVYEDYDPDDRYFQSYIAVVDVPPGRYRATVYSYVPGINGSAVLDHLAGGYDRHEKFGAWFRRTRPGEPFPPWLVYWCVADPDEDPGHEKEWRESSRPEESTLWEYIHFLVHLEPAPDFKAAGKPPEGGWFGEAEDARKPARCPLGLPGRDVQKHEDDSTGRTGWLYVHDVHERTRQFQTLPIAGDPVSIDLANVADLYRLARFSHGFSVPEIRAALPAGSQWTAPVESPEHTLVLQHDRDVRIAFGNDANPVELLAAVANVHPVLASMPEGTEIELSSSQLDEEALRADVPIGTHRYRGTMRGGVWRLEETFPKVDAATLRQALSLAGEVLVGDEIAVRDDAEREAIFAFANANYKIWIEDNPGRVRDGKLTLKKRDPGILALYGASAFKVRFGDTWPAMNLADDDEDMDEDGDDESALATPIQGTKMLETPGGRMYFATMSLLVSEKLTERIQAEEKALLARGYTHVADIVCNMAPKVAIRGYSKKEGDTWASYMVASPDTLVFELSTRFQNDDASLVTTRLRDARDDPAKKSYRQPFPEGTFAEMEQQHERRKAELAAIHGAPIVVQRNHEGFAQAIEAALRKQYGG
jgi:hypothetical protein